jgi:phosphoglycolate phosphatase
MKSRIIIFDMDGVLFDSMNVVSDFLLTTYPTLTKEIVREMLTSNFHDEIQKLKLTHKRIEETEEERKARSLQYSSKKSLSPLYPGIRELLERLHNDGHILTINTSALEKNCRPLLEYAKIADQFDFVATKELSTKKTEKFELIAKKYDVSKQDVVFITDTLGDIREADSAQVATIAVTWGAHDRSYFTREPHANLIGIVDKVSELEKLLV